MKNLFLSAEEALRKSQSIENQTVANNAEAIQKLITAAIAKSETHVVIYDNGPKIHPTVVKMLKEKGYKVTSEFHRNESMTTISWDEIKTSGRCLAICWWDDELHKCHAAGCTNKVGKNGKCVTSPVCFIDTTTGKCKSKECGYAKEIEPTDTSWEECPCFWNEVTGKCKSVSCKHYKP